MSRYATHFPCPPLTDTGVRMESNVLSVGRGRKTVGATLIGSWRMSRRCPKCRSIVPSYRKTCESCGFEIGRRPSRTPERPAPVMGWIHSGEFRPDAVVGYGEASRQVPECFFCKQAPSEPHTSMHVTMYRYRPAWNLKFRTMPDGRRNLTAGDLVPEEECIVIVPRCPACAVDHYQRAPPAEKNTILGEPWRAYEEAKAQEGLKQAKHEAMLRTSKGIHPVGILLVEAALLAVPFLITFGIRRSFLLAAVVAMAFAGVATLILRSLLAEHRNAALHVLPDVEGAHKKSASRLEEAEQMYNATLRDWEQMCKQTAVQPNVQRLPTCDYPLHLAPMIRQGWSETLHKERAKNPAKYSFPYDDVNSHLEKFFCLSRNLDVYPPEGEEDWIGFAYVLGQEKGQALIELYRWMLHAVEVGGSFNVVSTMENWVGAYCGKFRGLLGAMRESVDTIDLTPNDRTVMHNVLLQMDTLTDYAEYGRPLACTD